MQSENIVADLRSDTITQPDDAMKEAMTRAPLGDDVFGDDPTVRKLEAKAAELTGKEAALFVPSGTMGNTIAVAVNTRPGDEIILDGTGHTFSFECGGPARLWGVQSRTLQGERGRIALEAIEAAIRADDDIHLPRTSLVILEQTCGAAGGSVLPLDYVQSVGSFCRERGLRLHIDGARVFNASVASGVPVKDIAAPADTLMFCVSKGLGAPVGSLLAGSGERIASARRVRKLLGGGMRQAGVLAACGLYALESNVERLADDHLRARQLARSLEDLKPLGLEVDPPETNMVFLRWPGTGWERYRTFAARLETEGVLGAALFELGVRLVFHKDVGDRELEHAEKTLKRLLPKTLGG